MNGIEIDEKNGIAIVEPYVIHAQLHAEAIKRGWCCNIIGAGSSCSVVAAACAYSGIGAGTMWMGGNAENVLGMEWVTPSGEIVRNGSLGSGDGWFCSEGPAPRRARHHARHPRQPGRHGCLHQVRHPPGAAGPAAQTGQSTVPSRPTGFRSTRPSGPTHRGCATWDAWTDLYYKIYDNEIGYTLHRHTTWPVPTSLRRSGSCTTIPTKQLSDLPAMLEEPGMAELTEEMLISLQIVMAGRSEADIELQDKGSTRSSRKWAAGRSRASARRTWRNSPICT